MCTLMVKMCSRHMLKVIFVIIKNREIVDTLDNLSKRFVKILDSLMNTRQSMSSCLFYFDDNYFF